MTKITEDVLTFRRYTISIFSDIFPSGCHVGFGWKWLFVRPNGCGNAPDSGFRVSHKKAREEQQSGRLRQFYETESAIWKLTQK